MKDDQKKGGNRDVSKDEFFFKLAKKMDKNQNNIVKFFFQSTDTVLTMVDFIQIVESLDIIDRTQIPTIYNKLDPSGAGLSFKDFLKFFPEANKSFQEQLRTIAFQIHKSYLRLLRSFKEFDLNQQGTLPYLQVKNLLAKMNIECTQENLKELVNMLNADSSSLIDYQK